MCTISIHETTPKQLCILNIIQTIDIFKYECSTGIGFMHGSENARVHSQRQALNRVGDVKDRLNATHPTALYFIFLLLPPVNHCS